jgi:octaprenyl-diphosphate synthase
MAKHNALSDTLDRARHYGRMARDAMGLFPDSVEKRAFLDVVDFSIERGF